MSRTKTPTTPRRTKTTPNNNGAPPAAEVLTLAEAAAYLRVAPEEVVSKVSTEGLPGRRFGAEWRFFKTALQAWLSTPPAAAPPAKAAPAEAAPAEAAKKGLFETHFGALKDDPYLEEMLAEIYRQRGRPMTEEG